MFSRQERIMDRQSTGPVPKKHVLCIANILDISAKPIPLCSASSPPSRGPNYISLAPLLLKLTYFAMLFIFQVIAVCIT